MSVSKEVVEKPIDLADERVFYTGWRLYKKVTIIEHADYPNEPVKEGEEQIKKVYVADASDKKQLQTGRNWAEAYEYDPITKERKTIPGKEYTFENKGFTLCLSDSPGSSWQGGKLSFCMCIIKKDGHVWQTGIASDLLINLLKQSDCLKGEVQGEICFARNNGKLGMVRVGTESYNNAIMDDQIRKKISKTKKAKLGYEHRSLTQSNVWLCDVYNWIEKEDMYVTKIGNRYWGRVDHWFQKIKLADKSKLEHVYVEDSYIGARGCGEKYKTPPKSPDGVYTMAEVVQAAVDSFSPADSGYVWAMNMLNHTVDKFPARAIGRQLVRDEMTPKQFKQYKDACVAYYEALHDRYYNDKTQVNSFGAESLACMIGYTFDNVRPVIDIEKLKEWLKYFNGYVIVEIDGVEYMSDKLKHDLDTMEVTDLRIKR